MEKNSRMDGQIKTLGLPGPRRGLGGVSEGLRGPPRASEGLEGPPRSKGLGWALEGLQKGLGGPRRALKGLRGPQRPWENIITACHL